MFIKLKLNQNYFDGLLCVTNAYKNSFGGKPKYSLGLMTKVHYKYYTIDA